MKLTIFIIGLFTFLFSGCFWGDEEYIQRKLTKDFWLIQPEEKRSKFILLSTEDNGISGNLVIKNTVFAVGYNDNFIIAKQHPDKEDEISQRLFRDQNSKGDFEIKNLADTIYLSNDWIYRDSGKWYHVNNGWNPPDSLKPYKKITYYHIIDIRKYIRNKPDSYKIFTFNNENDFNIEREKQGVSKDLVYTIIDTTLE